MAPERRIDPEDGAAYTFTELSAYYSGKYKPDVIKAYWATCAPQKKGGAARGGGAKEKAGTKDEAESHWRLKKVKMEDITPSGFLVCGEALIDMIPTQSADGQAAFKGVPGGSPFNCCLASQRLDIPVSYFGVISDDLFGEQLYNHLKGEGVNLELVVRKNNPTTLAFVCREPGEGEKYAFFKENAADRQLTKAMVVKAMLGRRFRAVHMSLGAVTLEDGSMLEAFETLFKMGKKQGALRSFDPNLRPNMITCSAKAYSEKMEKFLRNVDLVKTSDADLEFLYGKDVNLADVASKWLKLGPKIVVITQGSKGAEAFIPDKDSISQLPPGTRPNTIDAEGNDAKLADSVGAGDTFMGGLTSGCLGKDASSPNLVAQIVDSKPWDETAVTLLRQVLLRAATCAAINCSRVGCNPPTLEQAEKVISKLTK